jgi:methionyl-tRNA synthetase
MPRIDEVDDLDGGPGYPVITGDYVTDCEAVSNEWAASNGGSGQPSCYLPLFEDWGR